MNYERTSSFTAWSKTGVRVKPRETRASEFSGELSGVRNWNAVMQYYCPCCSVLSHAVKSKGKKSLKAKILAEKAQRRWVEVKRQEMKNEGNKHTPWERFKEAIYPVWTRAEGTQERWRKKWSSRDFNPLWLRARAGKTEWESQGRQSQHHFHLASCTSRASCGDDAVTARDFCYPPNYSKSVKKLETARHLSQTAQALIHTLFHLKRFSQTCYQFCQNENCISY